MPEFNISDVVLLLPAIALNIYFWPRWYKKHQRMMTPKSQLEQGSQIRDMASMMVWIFCVLLVALAIYLPLAFVVYRYLPAPILLG